MDKSQETGLKPGFSNEHSSIPEFWHRKYRQDLGKNWNLFYKRNENRFFRDRHWMEHELPGLFVTQGPDCLLPVEGSVFEIGCGVGNFAFPLLELRPDVRVVGCDISQRAVELFQAHGMFDASKFKAFVADITKDSLEEKLGGFKADFASMIFVLSALPPELLLGALKNVAPCIKKDGYLLIRDYSCNDSAQLRFNPQQSRLDEHFFVRQDGTLAHFLALDVLHAALEADFVIVDSREIQSKTINHKEALELDRRFIHLLLRRK
jgi:methyltransferase-like protein 6